MTLFIWKRVDNVTKNWHTEAGIVVIAENLEKAREALSSRVEQGCEALKKDPDVAVTLNLMPKAEVFIFPDAGCC